MTLNRDFLNRDETLRKFGLALVRDGHCIADDVQARALVDKLCRQANLSLLRGDADPSDVRIELYRQFIRLYRRHLRKALLDEEFFGAAEASFGGAKTLRSADAQMRQTVSKLPVELRETLLLVVLAEFSHLDAAQTLGIPLTLVYERIARAREALANHVPLSPAADLPFTSTQKAAPHLRLIK